MFKLVCLIFFFTMMPRVYGQDCKVYGISDSPQKFDCAFEKQEVNMRCHNGDYYLDGVRIENAFHMEVEDGPVPLVFKTTDRQLTILIESKSRITAELEMNGDTRLGTCRL